MTITKFDIGTNPYIGAYLVATEKFVLAPPIIKPNSLVKIRDTLKVDIITITISGSSLLGVFIAANSNGILVPDSITDEELKKLKNSLDVNIGVIHSKYNSLGNLIVANDKGAITTPLFDKDIQKIIKETLNVELEARRIVSSDLLGTISIATNKGALVHPLATENEIQFMSKILKVPVMVGTVNLGSPYISVGIVANTKGALVGSSTTGPEIVRISQALELV